MNDSAYLHISSSLHTNKETVEQNGPGWGSTHPTDATEAGGLGEIISQMVFPFVGRRPSHHHSMPGIDGWIQLVAVRSASQLTYHP